jgi:hypothetical protein
MKRPPGPPRRVADVLGSVLQQVDPDRQLHVYSIWRFWDDEVGAAIAQRAHPAAFRNGTLFVTVATHSWMQELRFMKEELRARLNARLTADLVRDISFSVGPVGAPPPPRLTAAAGAALPAAAPIVLPPIDDPELAEAMSRVVAARARRLTRTPPPSRTRVPVRRAKKLR